jgi:hypothetical protein
MPALRKAHEARTIWESGPRDWVPPPHQSTAIAVIGSNQAVIIEILSVIHPDDYGPVVRGDRQHEAAMPVANNCRRQAFRELCADAVHILAGSGVVVIDGGRHRAGVALLGWIGR